jgi:hypothetical protein
MVRIASIMQYAELICPAKSISESPLGGQLAQIARLSAEMQISQMKKSDHGRPPMSRNEYQEPDQALALDNTESFISRWK